MLLLKNLEPTLSQPYLSLLKSLPWAHVVVKLHAVNAVDHGPGMGACLRAPPLQKEVPSDRCPNRKAKGGTKRGPIEVDDVVTAPEQKNAIALKKPHPLLRGGCGVCKALLP